MRMPCMKAFVALLAMTATVVTAQTGETALALRAAEHAMAAPAALFDRDAFQRRATVRSVTLSPDGRRVAWLAVTGLERSLHLLDTTTLQSARLFGSDKLQGIEWAADGKLVLDLGGAVGVLAPDESAAPTFIARLDQRRGDYFLGAAQAGAGGVLVVRMPQPGSHVLELVDAGGAARELLTTAERIEDAFLARSGERAFVETVTPRARNILEVRDGAARVLLTCPILARCELLAHDPDSDTLWLKTSHDSDLLSLQALTLADGKLRMVHSDPRGVVDLDVISLLGAEPVIASYHDGTVRSHALDASVDAHVAKLAELLPQVNLAYTLGAGGATWLVEAQSSVLREGRYYLYDSATMRLREILAETRNDALLPAEELSAKIPLEYRARDGKIVHGYVSLPKGRPLATTPLVAVPHGGPWAHITSGYDPLTQFLVNRGYIVFEPNFRASTGYGRMWMEAANREFGDGAVQHDIIDGVLYLLAQGIGDENRLGIVGTSFGGFSVLAGLAFTPELFKVGVAAVPPAAMGTSLRRLLEAPGTLEREPSLKEQMRLLLADIDDPADMQRLDARSPRAHLSAIEAPLLIAAGADDDRVDIAHVKQYTLDLFNLGKTVSLFIDEDEGHGLDAPLARSAFYYMTENMLALYLGGASQPLQDPVLTSYIRRKLLLNANPDFVIE